MSKLEKALQRVKFKPNDFTWSELVSLMSALEVELITGHGSARKFHNPATGQRLYIHQPHPSTILKPYQVLDVIDFLKQEGFLK